MPTLDLQLNIQGPKKGIPSKATLQAIAQAALDYGLKSLGKKVAHRYAAQVGVSIQMRDSENAKQYNAQYRKKAYATNVLSFPFEPPIGIKGYRLDYLGDLIVCPEVIEKEALQQGKTLRAHYTHMCVHGILHLLGFDHLTDSEAATMETLEKAVLASLGVADPYAVETNA